ncbi:MAG: GGDEF domain-containing protein [Deltaproteobacteria bacterium]|nr:GGDEF domain-containing protein [Deltaproteobacteria bacterium]
MSNGDEWDGLDEVTNVGTPAGLLDLSDRGELRGSLLVLAGANTGEMISFGADRVTIGRSEHSDVQLRDSGISRRHCNFIREGTRFKVEDLDSRNGTYVNGKRISRAILEDGDKVQLGRSTILRFSLQDRLDETFQKQLIDSALRDGMTKAYNRRYFLDRLDSEFKFSERHEQPLVLLILDLDHFKSVNDTFGHLAGDAALTAFAEVIQAQIRNEDVFARYGGEEFAIISRSIDLEGATIFAERLRRAVEGITVGYDGKLFKITVSIGISAFPEHRIKDPVELLEAADRALYAAKRHGRNQVAVYEGLPPHVEESDDTLR